MQELLISALLVATLTGCAGTDMHHISKEEARAVLTQFVNQEFQRKEPAEAHLAREGRLAWPRVAEQNWRVLELSRGRWVAATETQPAGFYIRASIDEFGKSPQLEAAMLYFP
jgi:hypothetical protein